MVTLLITSVFILGFLAVALYFWQKSASSTETEALLPPPEPRGLFIDGSPDGQTLAEPDSAAIDAARKRDELLDRAKGGEKSALQEARDTRDTALYDDVLNAFIASADSDPKLLSLVSYVTRHELLVNKKLAEKFCRLKVLFGDSAYGRSGLPAWTLKSFGWILQTVLRPVGVKGFVVLPKRWIVERTFAWLARYRRHSKDYEKTTASSEALTYLAMINFMTKRLANYET